MSRPRWGASAPRAAPAKQTANYPAALLACPSHRIQTLAGRRRYLPNIHSKNSAKRAAAERQAKNTVCQVGDRVRWGRRGVLPRPTCSARKQRVATSVEPLAPHASKHRLPGLPQPGLCRGGATAQWPKSASFAL